MNRGITSFTQKLISFRSEYPLENSIGVFLTDTLKTFGFRVEFQYPRGTRKRFNILATRGSGDRSIMFYGHQDTVPLYSERLWTHNPFAGEVLGDTLFGLGAYDMKAGIAAFLYALRRASGYVKVLLPFDEENISEGAWLAIQERRDFFSDVNLVISPEPSFGLSINNVSTARPGRSVYEIKFFANAAHVAEYYKGGDAVTTLGIFINTFHKSFHNQNRTFFRSPYSLAMIRRVSSESNGITAPAEAIVQIEAYIDKDDSEEEFIKALRSLAKSEVRLVPRKTPYLKAYRFTDFPYRELIKQIIKKHTGREMTTETRSCVGDDNVIASLGIPVLTWGPNGENAHYIDENVNISSLITLSDMFSEFLRRGGF